MQMVITKDYHLFERLAVEVDIEYDTFMECQRDGLWALLIACEFADMR